MGQYEQIQALYQRAHPGQPLTKTGVDNISKLCEAAFYAKMDLKNGTLKGKNGSETVKGILAEQIMEKAFLDPQSAQLLWDVNNPNYLDNMDALLSENKTFTYLTGRNHGANHAVFLKNHLEKEDALNAHADMIYSSVVEVGKNVDKTYYAQQAKKSVLGKEKDAYQQSTWKQMDQLKPQEAPVMQ